MRVLPIFLLLPVALPAQAPSRHTHPALLRTRDQLRTELSGPRALATTTFVERYWRLPGNTGFNAAIAHVAAILDSAGFVPAERARPEDRFTYRVERRPMARPTWEPDGGRVSLIGRTDPVLRYETNRHMLGMYSASTPAGGVEGELVSVGKGTAAELDAGNVPGKIVMGDLPLGRLYTEAVVRRGALGAMAYNMPAYTRPEANRHSIQFSGIPWDSARAGWGVALSSAARETLLAALATGPARVRVELSTRLYRAEELTLVAEVRGSTSPAERFVFSAHVQEPGANDNASGVGALAEMARVTAGLVRRGAQDPARTITFLWGDEISATARFLREDSVRAAGVRWGLSLDMVGEDTRKTGGTFLIEKMPDPSAIWTRGEDRHTEWGGAALTISQMTPHYFNDVVLNRCVDQATGTDWLVGTNPYEGGSDHVPFLRAQKPGILLWHFTDQFYHTDRDRIENVSPTELVNVGVCALATALTLTSADGATAEFLVTEVERAALDRIGRETALSVAAVTQGSSREQELQILTAWADWYRGALDSAIDLEVGGPSARVRARITRARDTVTQAFERARRQVFEE